jgi:hypothetical protein
VPNEGVTIALILRCLIWRTTELGKQPGWPTSAAALSAASASGSLNGRSKSSWSVLRTISFVTVY